MGPRTTVPPTHPARSGATPCAAPQSGPRPLDGRPDVSYRSKTVESSCPSHIPLLPYPRLMVQSAIVTRALVAHDRASPKHPRPQRQPRASLRGHAPAVATQARRPLDTITLHCFIFVESGLEGSATCLPICHKTCPSRPLVQIPPTHPLLGSEVYR